VGQALFPKRRALSSAAIVFQRSGGTNHEAARIMNQGRAYA